MAVTVFECAGGQLAIWVDEGVIMLKSKEPYGDPVELNDDEALELSDLLRRLADEVQ